MMSSGQISLWLTLVYGVAVPVIAVIYWRAYGPTNFLWLSDIALFFTLAALLSSNRLLATMAAVGVLALELAWTIDFLSGGRFIGLLPICSIQSFRFTCGVSRSFILRCRLRCF